QGVRRGTQNGVPTRADAPGILAGLVGMRLMTGRILAIACAILTLCSASALAADPEYFDVPDSYVAGTGIATAPDGTVWFVANPIARPDPSIGRLIPSQASPGTTNGVALFPTPALSASCCANGTRGIAYDSARGH